MPWEPMTEDDANRLLDNWPKSGTTDARTFARFIEARMVLDGREADDIRVALEKILGQPLD